MNDSLAFVLMALIGLAIGSFLNVVIYRLPIMIEQSFATPAPEPSPPLNLAFPASHCTHCLRPITWYDKLPVLSYAWLRGRCRHCQTPISWQYPLVELATAGLFVWSATAHPSWGAALAWAGFSAALLALAVIDARTTVSAAAAEAVADGVTVLTGSVVVETLFGLPGLGRYFVDAALNRDYTLVMGTVVLVEGTGKHTMAHVDFGEAGLKRLLLRVAPLVRL